MRVVATVLVLVVLATAAATGARRWRIPAPSLLVLIGVGVALVPGEPPLRIAPDTIALVVLPPLLYASAEELSVRDLRTVWKPVAVLAFGLVLASAAVVAVLASWLTPLSGAMAFVLGTVLASTDPVAVTALGRRLPLPGRVQVLVQAESLFNDATSLVLFKVAVAVAVSTGTLSAARIGGEFFLLAGGGTLVGAAVAGAVALLRRRTEDPVLETVIALVTPYAAYVLAEELHTSGVTAVVVAGVLLGHAGHRLSDARIRLQVQAVYAVVVFLLESVVFAVVGLELPAFVRELHGGGASGWPLQALVLAAALVAVRVLWMLPLSAAVRPAADRAAAERGARRGPSWRLTVVASWAGTRGVMPLAAALSIPLVTDDRHPLPGRPLILALTTAVVVVTLVVQGLTLAGVVNRSGIALEPEHSAREESAARQNLARAALERLAELADAEAVPATAVARARHGLEARLVEHDAEAVGERGAEADFRELRRDLIGVQEERLRRLYDDHRISEATRRRLQRELDLDHAGLGED